MVKFVLAFMAFALIGSLIYSQINMASAQALSQGPLSGPITSPTPTPIIKPITYFYAISGKVQYRFWLILRPAAGVAVEAGNINTREKVIAKTKADGSYTLQVKRGDYLVRAYDERKTNSMPFYRFVQVSNDVFNISFEGIFRSI